MNSMSFTSQAVIGVVTVVALMTCVGKSQNHAARPKLLLVIFDGFRWDYLEKLPTPTFHRLASAGVQARRVINVMPTFTMALHYTMLTGLYPESHGMVSNEFHDPNFGRYDMYVKEHQTQSHWFDTGAEPVYVTNQRAAKGRYSGAMMWPTALAPVKGVPPTYQKGPPLYDVSVKNKTRIDTLISWFLHPHKPINLGLLYFDEPDLIGHLFGPSSEQLNETVVALDGVLDYLIGQLKKHKLYNSTNIIITSDHGMVDVEKKRFINISEYVPMDSYLDYELTSLGLIYPKHGHTVCRPTSEVRLNIWLASIHRNSTGMSFTSQAVISVVTVVALMTVVGKSENHAAHPRLLLVIFDGFRWDYLEKLPTPTFRRLASAGVQARRVINVMPTFTMALHYTMLTGLYPESHGMVSNEFHDPNFGRYDMYVKEHQTQSHWFDTGAEPVYVTNQRAAKDRYSGAMMWPTALAPVKGVPPTYQKGPPLYDVSVKNKTRIDTLISWFLHPHKPINLGLLYFDEPDLIGHLFGPSSEQLNETVVALDGVLDYLIGQLKKHKLYNSTNIIITSDHGMVDVEKKRFINISEYVPMDSYLDYELTSLGLIYPKHGHEDAVYEGLLNAQKQHPQLKVYRKSGGILKALNYSRSARISPIVVVAEEGWYIVNKPQQTINPYRGLHGYPPSLDMSPIFMATGPSFKKGYFTETVRSIDLYELMCHLLDITPAPNNGSLAGMRHFLLPELNEDIRPGWQSVIPLALAMAAIIASGLRLLLRSKSKRH